MFYKHLQVGWNLWNLFIACFNLGCTVALYNGCPFYPEVGFWEMMDKFKVAYTFLATSVVDKMEKNDVIPGKMISILTLRKFNNRNYRPPENFGAVFAKTVKR